MSSRLFTKMAMFVTEDHATPQL